MQSIPPALSQTSKHTLTSNKHQATQQAAVRTKHDVLGRRGLVEVVQEAVVHRVDEELGAAGLGLAGVGL